MYICNQSIPNSTFPDKWKEGKVRPLYKNGPKDDTNNYRPISILPVISKLLEKHVHDSLMTYLTSHKLLHSTQSGFRPNHSCETALLQMVNKFLEAINSSQIIDMVMVDFRKAFDLVDHTLLLKKLIHYKLSDKTINWFSSYLLGRKQKVVINNIESSSTLDKQRICVNTQLKSSKKQLKLNVCVPKSNSNDRYAITCDVIAYYLVHFVSIQLINERQSGIDFIFTCERAIYSSFMKISVPSPVFHGKKTLR